MKYLNLILAVAAFIISTYLLLKPEPTVSIIEQVTHPETNLPVPKDGFINARSWDMPDSLFFAGERVPMDRTYIREMFDRELHINTYWHNNTIFLLKRANRWLPQMKPILEKYGIPEDFLYVSVIESGLINEVSPSGAVGYWQFMKGAAGDFGLEINKEVDERYHPLKATEAAAKYLKKAYERFGNWTNVAAAYNRGMAGMDRDLRRQQVNSYYDALLNNETSRYLFRVLAIKTIFKDPSQYGFDIKAGHLYEPESVKYVTVTETIGDLTTWAIEQGINLRVLKRHNPWLRSGKLTIRRGKSYEIAIPTNQ